MSIKPRSL